MTHQIIFLFGSPAQEQDVLPQLMEYLAKTLVLVELEKELPLVCLFQCPVGKISLVIMRLMTVL